MTDIAKDTFLSHEKKILTTEFGGDIDFNQRNITSYTLRRIFFFSATSAKAPKGLAMTFSENFPVNSATLLLFKFTLHKQEKKEKKRPQVKEKQATFFLKKVVFFFFGWNRVNSDKLTETR